MEQKNQNKWDTTKIVLAITAAVAVLALAGFLTWAVLSGIFNSNKGENSDTNPSATIPFETSPPRVVDTDEDLAEKKKDVVATVGDKELTNGQLQIYYWNQIYDFLSNYSSYLAYFGIDFTKPLNTQKCTLDETISWEECFIDRALDSWSQLATIAMMAEEDGFVLSEEQQQTVDAMTDNMEKMAVESGYKDLEEMLVQNMGSGAKVEDYIAYVQLDYYCSAYYVYLQEKNVPTDAQIEEYYAANEETIKSKGYGKDAGNLVDVRHILIQPEGGTLNADGKTKSYTDAAWESARQQAQVIYDLWLTGEKDEDSFAEYAQKNSADSSATNGGLIANVVKDQTVEEFDAWIFEEGREYGNHTMVKTVFGYHIMFFVGQEEAWVRYSRANYTSDIINTKMKQFAEKYSLATDYDKILIGQVNLLGEE